MADGVKVTVLTITFRPGYIDLMCAALDRQTMPKKDWEWVLVDDLWEQRHDVVQSYVGDSINLKHIPPREIKEYSATATAFNTGLRVAKGELVYFMSDYMYPHPRCLARHWQLYQQHGPKVFISGPLLDDLTRWGHSMYSGSIVPESLIQVGKDLYVTHENIPPVPVALRDGFDQAIPGNYISVLSSPFVPEWPEDRGVDWRVGALIYEAGNVWLDPITLWHKSSPTWWWAGRNDSAPLEMVRNAGGLDESEEWVHGGLDGALSTSLKAQGGRYLVDTSTPCYFLVHPANKRRTP